ncbi:hypothetical protein OIU80_00640 [Flavobacterium sp. LS1R47]|jgi:hypothetical protein|uniref:Uncharacterized protein n=1 Tax=Flavobacterium frigoritolerans TaxID=2987686 RepID=A0A9X3BZU3_9FLAO|nr:hypothetical protein [Flavobacterium frigoritolerans]MCV9930775.1 hypothetical protein [Flavobacterium frigoritolerans]
MKTNSTPANDVSLNSNALENNPLITIPTGLKSAYYFTKGDAVSAISVKLNNGKIKLSSSIAKVSFSVDTESQSQSKKMVHLLVPSNDIPYFICDTNLPFLLPNGKYTRADKLIPGQKIVDKNGKPLLIEDLSIKNYNGGLHHISTNVRWNNTPNGHLLLANGIVVGDFTLQVYFDQIPLEMIQ